MTLADAGAAHRTELAVVRSMTTDDAAWAAEVHAEALPHGFFARLGRRFLAAYYESFVDSPHAVAFVADSPGGPAGMLVGTLRNSAHYSWVLRRHGPRLVGRGLTALLASPRVMLLFLRTRMAWYCGGLLRFARRAVAAMFRSAPPSATARQPAVLTHVAVDPQARRSGAGGALVAAFTQAASAAGCREAVLVTLAGPAGAGPFYRRLGWTLRDRHDDHDGRLLECYYRRL